MDYYTRIEDYVNGRISGEHLVAFEKAMEGDSELERAVRLFQSTSTMYDGLLESELRRQIVKIDLSSTVSEKRKEKNIRNLNIKRVLAIAATILILLTALCVWYARSNYSDVALVSRYLDMPNISGTRDAGEDINELTQARMAYASGDYQQCIAIITAGQSWDPGSPDVRQMLAYSYLASGDHGNAIAELSSLSGSGNGRKERAEFHLALAYLQSGGHEKAVEVLTNIIGSNGHAYREESIMLAANLQSKWRVLTFE